MRSKKLLHKLVVYSLILSFAFAPTFYKPQRAEAVDVVGWVKGTAERVTVWSARAPWAQPVINGASKVGKATSTAVGKVAAPVAKVFNNYVKKSEKSNWAGAGAGALEKGQNAVRAYPWSYAGANPGVACTISPGQTHDYSLIVTNTGSQTWTTSDNIHLQTSPLKDTGFSSYVNSPLQGWIYGQGKKVSGFVKIYSNGSIAPDSSAVFRFTVKGVSNPTSKSVSHNLTFVIAHGGQFINGKAINYTITVQPNKTNGKITPPTQQPCSSNATLPPISNPTTVNQSVVNQPKAIQSIQNTPTQHGGTKYWANRSEYIMKHYLSKSGIPVAQQKAFITMLENDNYFWLPVKSAKQNYLNSKKTTYPSLVAVAIKAESQYKWNVGDGILNMSSADSLAAADQERNIQEHFYYDLATAYLNSAKTCGGEVTGNLSGVNLRDNQKMDDEVMNLVSSFMVSTIPANHNAKSSFTKKSCWSKTDLDTLYSNYWTASAKNQTLNGFKPEELTRLNKVMQSKFFWYSVNLHASPPQYIAPIEQGVNLSKIFTPFDATIAFMLIDPIAGFSRSASATAAKAGAGILEGAGESVVVKGIGTALTVGSTPISSLVFEAGNKVLFTVAGKRIEGSVLGMMPNDVFIAGVGVTTTTKEKVTQEIYYIARNSAGDYERQVLPREYLITKVKPEFKGTTIDMVAEPPGSPGSMSRFSLTKVNQQGDIILATRRGESDSLYILEKSASGSNGYILAKETGITNARLSTKANTQVPDTSTETPLKSALDVAKERSNPGGDLSPEVANQGDSGGNSIPTVTDSTPTNPGTTRTSLGIFWLSTPMGKFLVDLDYLFSGAEKKYTVGQAKSIAQRITDDLATSAMSPDNSSFINKNKVQDTLNNTRIISPSQIILMGHNENTGGFCAPASTGLGVSCLVINEKILQPDFTSNKNDVDIVIYHEFDHAIQAFNGGMTERRYGGVGSLFEGCTQYSAMISSKISRADISFVAYSDEVEVCQELENWLIQNYGQEEALNIFKKLNFTGLEGIDAYIEDDGRSFFDDINASMAVENWDGAKQIIANATKPLPKSEDKPTNWLKRIFSGNRNIPTNEEVTAISDQEAYNMIQDAQDIGDLITVTRSLPDSYFKGSEYSFADVNGNALEYIRRYIISETRDVEYSKGVLLRKDMVDSSGQPMFTQKAIDNANNTVNSFDNFIKKAKDTLPTTPGYYDKFIELINNKRL